jgi:dolichyl-phosphate-mannose--protein O-mannosyl transferase
MIAAESRRFAWALAAATVLAAVLRWYRIGDQPPLSDEVHMALTAMGYVGGGQTLPTMPHHPNLRNLLIFASLRLFGTGSVGLRFFSLLLGTLSVPLVGIVVRAMTKRPVAAGLAAFFLAVDPLHVAFSRQAIQETHVVFFALLGSWIALVFLERLDRGVPLAAVDGVLLLLVGLVFGLAIASKYQAVFPLLVFMGIVLVKAIRLRDVGLAVLAAVSFVLVPVTVLALTDAPWFQRGYGLADWAFMRSAVFERMSARYVPAVTELNPDRNAWEWFVNPLLGYASFSTSEGKPFVVVGMGNPLVWLLVLPSALLAAMNRSLRRRTLTLQALFWATYLPFLATGRPIFFLTALAVAPFAFGLVGAALDEIVPAARRRILYGYGGAVLAASLFLQPLSMGTALDHGYSSALVQRFDPHAAGGPRTDR